MFGLKKGKPGFNHWWMQRLSAIALAITGVWLLVLVLQDQPFAYEAARDWFKDPLHYALSLVFALGLLIHFYLGLEKILNDYVHNEKVHKIIMGTTLVCSWIAAVGFIGILTVLLSLL